VKITMLAAITATVAATFTFPPTAHADPTPPCSNGQVVVTAGPTESGLGHRGVTLPRTPPIRWPSRPASPAPATSRSIPWALTC